MVDEYMEPTDKPALKKLRRWTGLIKDKRDMLSHGLWYYIHGSPEYIVLVDQHLMYDDVFRIQAGTGSPEQNKSMATAKIIEESDLRGWLARIEILEKCWGILLVLASGRENEDSRLRLRTLLSTQLGMTPPPDPSRNTT